MVGGITLSLILFIQKIDSIAPAAPRVCPVMDFVELTLGTEEPNIFFKA